MIGINNKEWSKLRSADVKKQLENLDGESLFFEFKSDDESPAKLAKEVSAFSNTYGGYIFLGVNDDKSIGGCKKWSEQRIHTSIHDSIIPTPNIDVRKFIIDGESLFVIKVEEGKTPPYITNRGEIFERLSSGSFPIKDSGKLNTLYIKHQDNLNVIKEKVELPKLTISSDLPNNLCGYIDFGFSITNSEPTRFQKNFYTFDYEPVSTYLKSQLSNFSISRVGASIVISTGSVSLSSNNKLDTTHIPIAGLNNFIEIMYDGSVRARIMLIADVDTNQVTLTPVVHLQTVFKELYSIIMGKDFIKTFVHAQKYEKLTVLKQFEPYYNFIVENQESESAIVLNNAHKTHQSKYGKNLIIESNRYPKTGYSTVDQQRMSKIKLKYNFENLVDELFHFAHFNLGFIDI